MTRPGLKVATYGALLALLVACGDSETSTTGSGGDGGTAASGGTGGSGGDGGEGGEGGQTGCPAGDPDSDGDGICDSVDVCAGSDDGVDADGDGVPDACDLCAGQDDGADADSDMVPDGCDVCPGADDAIDLDSDGVPDGCDVCAGFDDTTDTDSDGVPNGCDVCGPGDDNVDTDSDTVPDACDVCDGFDDTLDADGDNVPDGCDICAGFDDTVDSDNDTVPDGCDLCAGFDDALDADNDTVPDGCDICDGFDDTLDADNDTVPDGCDLCAGFDDALDADNDTVPDGCDLCAGFDDAIDVDADSVPDDCDPCDSRTDVELNGVCYYLDGSRGVCEGGYQLAPQSILNTIATQFVGKLPKNQQDNNCCIVHADQAAEGQDWGLGAPDCNAAGPYQTGPQLGAFGCTNASNDDPTQLTLCQSGCDPTTEVAFNGRCYYLDGSNGVCDAGYELAPQSVLASIATQFVGKLPKNQPDNNCCIVHADQAAEGQDWGLGAPDCNAAGPYQTGPQLGAFGCTDQQNSDPTQLTLCVSQTWQ